MKSSTVKPPLDLEVHEEEMNCKTSTINLPISKVEDKNPGKALVDSKVVPATGGTAACRAAADRKEEDTIGVRRIVAVVELDIH